MAEKVFLLREFDETLEPYEKDISDPIGGSYQVYLNCRDQIEQGIASLLIFMEQNQLITGARTASAPGLVKFALGADHGGYELKEALKQHLQKLGWSVKDFGTQSTDSVDYPDFAQAVAQAVTAGQAEFGLLVCTTGIGMSISANKYAGIRAALVWNEELAAISRRHNNANVLCLGGRTTPAELGGKILDAFLAAEFEGGRHDRRLRKLDVRLAAPQLRLRQVDPAVAEAIELERLRQQENIAARRCSRRKARCSPTNTPRATPKNAGTGAAKTLTPLNNWPLTGPDSCSAPNTPMSSRTPGRARTWRCTSPC
jgi:RpiB/LacA/LacB family sugar-phosphate isomerase